PFYDEISGVPMASRLMLQADAYQIMVWIEGEVILSSSTVTVVLDVMSPEGAQPVRSLGLLATDLAGRQWSAEIDLRQMGFGTYRPEPERVVLRYRLSDPFGPQFSPEVCSKRHNKVTIDVKLRTADSDKAIELGQLEV